MAATTRSFDRASATLDGTGARRLRTASQDGRARTRSERWRVDVVAVCCVGALARVTRAVSDVKDFCHGQAHACAILADDTIRCWGENDYGQCGVPNPNTGSGGTHDIVSVPSSKVEIASSSLHPTKIVCGNSHTCALLNNGSVKCWGRNDQGQLGVGTFAAQSNQYAWSLPPSSNTWTMAGKTATDITAGQDHTCVILNDSKVMCWGLNGDKQLGCGSGFTGNQYQPCDVGYTWSGNVGASAISASLYGTCAVTASSSKRIKCWGDGIVGQQGVGGTPADTDDPLFQSEIVLDYTGGSLTNAVKFIGQFSLSNTVCVVWDYASNGGVCWGECSNGMCGSGASDLFAPNVAGSFYGSGAAGKLLGIASGSSHTCALIEDGTVRCWGTGNLGQLGYGNTNSISYAGGAGSLNFGTGRTATKISAGQLNTCALLDSGDLSCWGYMFAGDGTSQFTYSSPFAINFPCDASSAPTNGGVGTCTNSLASGLTCQPTCNTGYTVSGTSSCTRGILTAATCNPNACDASAAPANGGVGTCTNSLASGSTCQPTCNTGYTVSGTSSCSLGTLTAATCIATPPPTPTPTPPTPTPLPAPTPPTPTPTPTPTPPTPTPTPTPTPPTPTPTPTPPPPALFPGLAQLNSSARALQSSAAWLVAVVGLLALAE